MRRLKYAIRYFLTKLYRRPVLINLEVTKRCNAGCDFCDYHQTPPDEKVRASYKDIIARFKPFTVSITGGEPLIRKDLENIIKEIKEVNWGCYVGMITNGSLLTRERALSLRKAGLDQISISLDFPDERHDKSRGIPGLFKKIISVIPEIKKMGFYRISFNTVIMKDNLDDILNIAELARELGIYASFSTYCSLKTGNLSHIINSNGDLHRLEKVIDRLMEYKRKHRNIMNSTFYLSQIPYYFSNGGIPGCQAGMRWFQVSPQGGIKRCSEFEPEYTLETFPGKFTPTSCTLCWYSCRGENEAPVNIERMKELAFG